MQDNNKKIDPLKLKPYPKEDLLTPKEVQENNDISKKIASHFAKYKKDHNL